MIRWLAPLLLAACNPTRSTPTATSTSAASSPLPSPPPQAGEGVRRGVEFVAFSGTEALDGFVMRELRRAERDKRELLLYVGASWCEPCQRFHEAAKRGELDADFPTLRLVDLDRDRDEAELTQTSCLSEMIPMFARPTPRGNCSNEMIFGSIKGPGAIDNIRPRLKRLLEGR